MLNVNGTLNVLFQQAISTKKLISLMLFIDIILFKRVF